MTFSEYANKSVHELRVLIQLDIGKQNLQWVNIGAGIWYCNFNGLYPEVGAPGDDLLKGFTSQIFGDIGSVLIDNVNYVKVNSVELLSTTEISFYYDIINNKIYIHLINNDEPYLHFITLGVINGFSYDDYTPINSETNYSARLLNAINLTESRDPLFFGKIQYNQGNISLINNDGFFDSFVLSNDFYGNSVRILIGFKDLDISEYELLYSATISKVELNENTFDISLSDKRKALSKTITYTCTAKNALEAIRELLYTNYGAIYNSVYYNTTQWATCESIVDNVSIDIQSGKSTQDKPMIEIIEDICGSIFGLFKIEPDGKYNFKIVDTTSSASATITSNDVINQHLITYDPLEVISSTKIGYAKNWDEGYTSPYTFYTDVSQEQSIFRKYKVYTQKQFNTLLTNSSDAITFSDIVLNYSKDVHGIGSVEVPLKYYAIQIGDIVNIEINRETTTLLGTVKCEIISKSLELEMGFITFGYRII